MTFIRVFLMVTSLSLAACGGGGDSSTTLGGTQSSATYKSAPPVQGTQNLYSEMLLDNQNNTINRNLLNTILAVNPDGSFSVGFKDPNNNIVKTGSVDHSVYPQIYNYASNGNEIDRTIFFPNETSTICTASAFSNDGTGASRSPGVTVNYAYTETCGTSPPVSYKISSLYVGQEAVTVPAGTFQSYRFQDSVTYTTPNGTTVTDTATYWRSITDRGTTLIKATHTFSYGGTTPALGAPLSTSRVLLSQVSISCGGQVCAF